MDFVFVIMFLLYLPLRIVGLKNDHQLAATEALSILSQQLSLANLSQISLIQFSTQPVLAPFSFQGDLTYSGHRKSG